MLRFITAVSYTVVMVFAVNAQPHAGEVSTIHQAYLEKVNNIESQLSSIEIKWSWIEVTPSEDSIAKAEGWYVKQAARRDQLQLDLITIKFEQLLAYDAALVGLIASNKIGTAEIEQQRLILAPNYPALPGSAENAEAAKKKWIIEYPDEYENFTAHLEKVVLGHQ